MSFPEVADRISALAAVAADWREPDHPEREAAVTAARAAENHCTAEAMAFTINQRMHTLTEEALTAWAAEIPQAATPQSVALLDGAATPLATFNLWVALVLAGHTVQYRPPDAFPSLLPAIADAVTALLGSPMFSLATAEEKRSCNAVIAKSNLAAHCSNKDIPQLRLGGRTTVAIIENPNDETWENLAEDALLYDGEGDASPRLLFAPAGLEPDGFLEACAHFRAIYPAHKDTPGRLKMQQAMLEALDVPHGYSDDLGFLVSKGEAEVQSPGHIRWVPYASFTEIGPQLPSDLHLVIAADDVAAQTKRVPSEIPLIHPGTAHRPPIEGHTSKDQLVRFLEGLAASGSTAKNM